MDPDASARAAMPMKVLRIGRSSLRYDRRHAIEHLEPARVRARVPGERFGDRLLERELRAAPHLRERDGHDRLAWPPRIVTGLHRLDLVPVAVGRRERVDDALRPHDLAVNTDDPAIAEPRIVDAGMKAPA